MAANPTRSNEQDKQKDCVPVGVRPRPCSWLAILSATTTINLARIH